MKRLLITGGHGFIGRHCIEPALREGFEVHATTSRAPFIVSTTPDGVTWHKVDLLARGAIEELVDAVKPTHVLHTAWETTHGSYWTSPSNLDWLGLITRFLPAFAHNGGRRFVAAGSCAEYDWSAGVMREDVTPELPHTFYGRIKLAHHRALMASAEQFGFSAATGRIFFGYGPHENPARIIPYACRQLASGQAAEFSSGTFLRDFMHVDDIGRGFVALLDGETQGACNVSSEEAVSLAEIVTHLGKIAGRPDLVRLGVRPDRPDDPPLLLGVNERLRRENWAPRISLADGLAQTYEWWQRAKSEAIDMPSIMATRRR